MNRLTKHGSTILLAAYALTCLLFFVDDRWHPRWDSGIYLLTARSLVNGEGYRYLGEPFFMRPPGFSLFLMPIVTRTGDFDFHTLNLVVMCLAVGSVVALYHVMRRFRGRGWALVVALLFGTSPLFASQLNSIMSEFLFLVLVFCGLVLLVPYGRGTATPLAAWFCGAAMIAFSILVRAAGLVIVPGLAALRFRRERGARRLLAIGELVLVLTVMTPWIAYSSWAIRAAPRPATQLLNFTYATPMLHVDPGDPSSPLVTARGWAARLARNGAQLIADVGDNLGVGSGPTTWIAAAIVVLGFVGACMQGASILEWLALSYTFTIVVYATYDQRLVLPLVFLFYHYGLVALDRVFARRAEPMRRLGRALAAVLAVALLARNATAMASTARAPVTFPLAPAVEWVRQNTPGDAVVLTDLAPEFSVLSGRRTYSYLYLRGAPLPDVDYVAIHGVPPSFELDVQRRSRETVLLPGADGGARIYRMR